MLTFAAHAGRFGLGHWIADTIARGLIYRAIWAVTRGMNATEVVGLAVVAIIVAIAWSRRA
jgi:hypothetical protein